MFDVAAAGEISLCRSFHFAMRSIFGGHLISMEKAGAAVQRSLALPQDRWPAGGAGAQDPHGCEYRTRD